jgi:LysM repeat protein
LNFELGKSLPIFERMKRQLILAGFLAASLGANFQILAQDAAAIAEREEAESRYKRTNARVQELEETLQAHQKTIMRLTDEVHRLSEDVSRLTSRNENAATQESIRKLAEKIEEVDRKRQADNDLVLAQLKGLGAKLALPIQKPGATEKPGAGAGSTGKPFGAPPLNNALNPTGDGSKSTPAVPESGYEYSIKSGDTLDKILRDLRAHGMKLTQKQVMDANPGVNWNKLKIGQKIFIPAPPQ